MFLLNRKQNFYFIIWMCIRKKNRLKICLKKKTHFNFIFFSLQNYIFPLIIETILFIIEFAGVLERKKNINKLKTELMDLGSVYCYESFQYRIIF